MSRERMMVIGLFLLQIIAIALYPPTFFRESPQSAVLPPSLFLLIILTLLGMNTGVIAPLTGRVSLVFVQGINIVVRAMMLFPNMKNSSGTWNWLFIILMLVGAGFSWLSITQMEKRSPRLLLLRQKSTD